jgi:hypothetical protein
LGYFLLVELLDGFIALLDKQDLAFQRLQFLLFEGGGEVALPKRVRVRLRVRVGLGGFGGAGVLMLEFLHGCNIIR